MLKTIIKQHNKTGEQKEISIKTLKTELKLEGRKHGNRIGAIVKRLTQGHTYKGKTHTYRMEGRKNG